MIKDFIIGEGALSVDGEVLPDERLQDNLYLLDAKGIIISCREARPLLKMGDDFFGQLGTDAAELNALIRTLEAGEDTMYLMQCGPLPVLMIRYLWRGNRTLLAVIPRKELAQPLRTPGAYAEILFPRELAFSPFSASKIMPADERVFREAQEWIGSYRCMRAANEEYTVGTLGLRQFLTLRTVSIAKLCGVRALYYYSGIGYVTVQRVNYPLLIADLVAVMMSVRCAAREQTVYLSIEREGERDPMIYARFYLDQEVQPPELNCSRRPASLSGAKLSLFEDAVQSGLWHVRLPICMPELEAMELRASLTLKKYLP